MTFCARGLAGAGLAPQPKRMKHLTTVVLATVVLGACDANKIDGPAPAILTPVQLQWHALPGSSSGGTCQPTIDVSLSGPVGARLTWTGMGIHTQENTYDQNFDLTFVQRFWAADGLAAGESTSSNQMGFGSGFVHITYRFMYRLSTTPGISYTDSISTLCE
jgi:hypothetical protein